MFQDNYNNVAAHESVLAETEVSTHQKGGDRRHSEKIQDGRLVSLLHAGGEY